MPMLPSHLLEPPSPKVILQCFRPRRIAHYEIPTFIHIHSRAATLLAMLRGGWQTRTENEIIRSGRVSRLILITMAVAVVESPLVL